MNSQTNVVSFKKGEGMPSKNGYVSLWRDIQKQDWYKDSQAVHLFTHFLLTATNKSRETNFKGQPVYLNQGQLFITYSLIEKVTGISKEKARRLIGKFKKQGQISVLNITESNRIIGQIITILGYKKWQKSDTPTDTPTDTPETAEIKAFKGYTDTLPDTPTDTQNNNVLNNKEKSMTDSNESISQKPCYQEIRLKAFEHFWKTWSKSKKLVGKINTASKQKSKQKFLSVLNESHVNKLGIDNFRTEISLMCELAIEAHQDISENQESSFYHFENMQPPKFISNKLWRECDQYRGML